MVNHLILQRQNQFYLLIQYPDRYHIITVNKRLEKEIEERILASVCNDAFLDEMGLKRETIPKQELRGVAVGGRYAGDVVVLYRGREKLKFVLSDDYTAEYIDGMFASVERFPAPKSSASRNRNHDWRKELQDPAMMNGMGLIGSALNLAGGAHFFLNLLFSNSDPLWFMAGFVISLVAFLLYLVFPQYYSIMGKKEYKRAGYTANVTQLEFAVLFPMLSVSISAMSLYQILDWPALLIWMAAISVAAIVLLCCFSREAKENTGILVAFSLVMIFVSMGISEHLNHVLNFHGSEPQPYVVTEKEYRNVRRGPDSYECTVILEDGTELEVDVPRDIYHQIQEGDQIFVYIGPGGLGIEYAYFVGIV